MITGDSSKKIDKYISDLDSLFKEAPANPQLTTYHYTDQDIFGDAKPGEIVTDRAFISTSIDPEATAGFGNTKIIFDVPAGNYGISAFGQNVNDHELELTLNRDLKYEILSKTDNEIHVKIVK